MKRDSDLLMFIVEHPNHTLCELATMTGYGDMYSGVKGDFDPCGPLLFVQALPPFFSEYLRASDDAVCLICSRTEATWVVEHENAEYEDSLALLQKNMAGRDEKTANTFLKEFKERWFNEG